MARLKAVWTERAFKDKMTMFERLASKDAATAWTTVGRIDGTVDVLCDFPKLGNQGRLPDTLEFTLHHPRLVLAYSFNSTRIYIVHLLRMLRPGR